MIDNQAGPRAMAEHVVLSLIVTLIIGALFSALADG
jgi:hypothetical protein